ncbi:nucleoside triphosphate pyrophosphohydrolase [Thermohalobacter berrensis]|uniref:Nucleoside triphosphate pyrophosphohydrolase n=1 Tax=Thermohalobacter berrensis TaxID=99594 RepID=A0A419T8M2_9FIRM|nr:nucleoside triphosphate pyrophosphohydrolase [Thermohalobacter berrensis]RKD33894.1 nucleoside triphosphate pyrophosphohydrolase [Thermohalobacter berrensis]
MGKIVVIGLGPGDIGSLTLEAVERLKSGNKVILRTEKHPTVEYLKKNNIKYETYDYMYEKWDDFEEVYKNITKDLVAKSQKYDIINYCVPGHPLVAEKTVDILLRLKEEGKVSVEIIPGMSFIDPIISAIGRDPIEGLKILDGLNLKKQTVDINSDNIITQVYNRMVASEVKLILSDIYGDEYEVYIVRAAGVKEKEKIVKVPLYELDRIDWIDYLTSIYIPKMKEKARKRYDMNNLIHIMEKLRSKEGCPWDIKQTHESLREYVLEEAYEVVDAIDNDDIDGLAEELGDLLLQVVFHSQIAKEEGYFNIYDITSNICTKLINRHPHVFGDIKVSDDKEVLANWNKIKDKEKNIKKYTERLEDIPNSLSALMKSYKVQKRAADVGFDWPNIEGAISKVKEELDELLKEINSKKNEKIEEELGDLLFAIVNISRFLDINPEVALNKTILKFIKRFKFIEEQATKNGKDLNNMTLEEMDGLWEEAKIHKN